MRLHPASRASSKRPGAAPSQIELLDAHDDRPTGDRDGELDSAWPATPNSITPTSSHAGVAQLGLEVNQ